MRDGAAILREIEGVVQARAHSELRLRSDANDMVEPRSAPPVSDALGLAERNSATITTARFSSPGPTVIQETSTLVPV